MIIFVQASGVVNVRAERSTKWGSITVRQTSSLAGLDLTKQVQLLLIEHKQSS